MDPLETLRKALEEAKARRWAGAREYLSYYTEWRGKFGHEPVTPGGAKGDAFAADLRRACHLQSVKVLPTF